MFITLSTARARSGTVRVVGVGRSGRGKGGCEKETSRPLGPSSGRPCVGLSASVRSSAHGPGRGQAARGQHQDFSVRRRRLRGAARRRRPSTPTESLMAYRGPSLARAGATGSLKPGSNTLHRPRRAARTGKRNEYRRKGNKGWHGCERPGFFPGPPRNRLRVWRRSRGWRFDGSGRPGRSLPPSAGDLSGDNAHSTWVIPILARPEGRAPAGASERSNQNHEGQGNEFPPGFNPKNRLGSPPFRRPAEAIAG